jgi:hypothetical protein
MNRARSILHKRSGIIVRNGVIAFISQHGLDLAQTVSITFGLFATCYTIRADRRSRRIDNLLTITEHHREIWTELYSRPALRRVMQKEVNINNDPITDDEQLFVLFLVLHLASSFRAQKEGMFLAEAGLRRDIREFFDRPIPKRVWELIKVYQEADFIEFVEAARRSTHS